MQPSVKQGVALTKVGQHDFRHLREKYYVMGTIWILASVDEILYSVQSFILQFSQFDA